MKQNDPSITSHPFPIIIKIYIYIYICQAHFSAYKASCNRYILLSFICKYSCGKIPAVI